VLRLGLAGLILPRYLTSAEAAAQETETHGLSIFGDLAMLADFTNFPYVNPNAPKGGEISLQVSSTSGNQNFTTFNTLNIYILKGDGAAGMSLIFDSRICRKLYGTDAWAMITGNGSGRAAR
jgi:microcin C transport system substrate-binding protein